MEWKSKKDIIDNFQKTGHSVDIHEIVDHNTTFQKEFKETIITQFLQDAFIQAWIIQTSKKTSQKSVVTYFREHYKNNHLLFFIEPKMKDCHIALKSKNEFFIFDVDFTKPPTKLLKTLEELIEKKAFIDEDMTMRQCALTLVSNKTDINVSTLTLNFNSAFKVYQRSVEIDYIRGNASEASYYGYLQEFLKNFFPSPIFNVIVLPNGDSTGKPDSVINRGDTPIIRIEAKNVDDPVEDWLNNPTSGEKAKHLADQIFRYREEDGKSPVVVTDFKSFWIIDNNSPNRKDKIEIKEKYEFLTWNSEYSMLVNSPNTRTQFEKMLINLYFDINKAIEQVRDLLNTVVPYAKDLRKELMRILDTEPTKSDEKSLKKYLEQVQEDLMTSIFKDKKGDLKKHFIDLYVQTVIYGIFMGWIEYNKQGIRKPFNIDAISHYLPDNSFIQDIFNEIDLKITGSIRTNILSRIEEIFANSEFKIIKSDTHELMTTFYSDFLDQYDPETKKDMGVVYTPDPVVKNMINGIDFFLNKNFQITNGILDDNIKFLDPAAGTMAYSCWLLIKAKNKIDELIDNDSSKLEEEKQKEFEKWFHNSFRQNIYAFEILMAPYILGHLRVLFTAEELGAIVDYKNDKINLFLMNTLMDQFYLCSNPKMDNEVKNGLNIRTKEKILVVMGNPPYNTSSQNDSPWIIPLVNQYIDNSILQRKGTKKITGLKSMKDDYIKFLRFAQWKIAEDNKQGLVAFITNCFYLDGLAARGMRYCLKLNFDEIWIIDLHGDWKKRIPKRILNLGIKKDENIFDIGTGVAIVFLLRYENHSENIENCKVYYSEFWGTKKEKFEFLSKNITEMDFTLVPNRQDYEFTPDYMDSELKELYIKFPYIPSIFYKNIQGVVSAHDTLVSNVDKNRLIEIIENFYGHKYDKKMVEHKYKDRKRKETKGKKYEDNEISFNDARDFQILDAFKGNISDAKSAIIEWQYRGFDRRYICYYPYLLNKGTERWELMQYLLPHQNNMTLVINRQSRGKAADLGSSVLISDTIIEHACNEGPSGMDSYVFPLKINLSKEKDNFSKPKLANCYNIRKNFKSQLPYSKETNEEEIFFYIYGILNTPIYRDKYKTELKKDFPHIPFPDDYELFKKMYLFGKELGELHLFKSKNIDIKTWPISEVKDRKLIKPVFDKDENKIYFDKFSKKCPKENIFWIGYISEEMWNFEIGGILQLEQWLSSRLYNDTPKKEHLTHELNVEELKYFLKLCSAIKQTVELRTKLDELYEEIEGKLYDFNSKIQKSWFETKNPTRYNFLMKKGFTLINTLNPEIIEILVNNGIKDIFDLANIEIEDIVPKFLESKINISNLFSELGLNNEILEEEYDSDQELKTCPDCEREYPEDLEECPFCLNESEQQDERDLNEKMISILDLWKNQAKNSILTKGLDEFFK